MIRAMAPKIPIEKMQRRSSAVVKEEVELLDTSDQEILIQQFVADADKLKWRTKARIVEFFSRLQILLHELFHYVYFEYLLYDLTQKILCNFDPACVHMNDRSFF